MAKYPEHRIKVPRFSEANGFYTTKARSEMMGKIKATDSKPEQKLRKFLWGLGLRYRKNVKNLPGKPDIVFRKYKLVIFVDGEFWHGRNWSEKKQKLKTNREFWIPKIERNMQRDREINAHYQSNNWKILRFWDAQVKKEFVHCAYTILDYIDTYEKYGEENLHAPTHKTIKSGI